MRFTDDSQSGGTTNLLQETGILNLRVKLLHLYILFTMLILGGASVIALLLNSRLETNFGQ